MVERLPVALSAGLLAGVWVWGSDSFALSTWAGFLGCSAYSALGEHSIKGVLATWAATLSGVFWAWVVFFGTDLLGGAGSAVLTGLVTAAMCLQAAQRLLAFIPAAFIGCCVVFALNGDVASAWLPLMLGAVMGFGMSRLGDLFARMLPFTSAEESK
ncbi:DUF1097 family protein [Shewanella sp. JM162201]|uniref:DUF1097 family protein n=1 Tax=Shewanella jiangmenensis TaxID=2837387 RepID=A0ABS5V7N4_9GAMM|nr:DUF1097 domain-containing protein [Shewanella jiangmenensis]MBT1446455.1 DUF1097 family protein [Shewanella jiangmenensis]